MKEIKFYKKADGKEPFKIWINKLDNSVRIRIDTRLDRLIEGNYGNCKKLSEDLSELKFNFAGGYRIYFTETSDSIIILLCGGDKSTQSKDIQLAKEYINDLKRCNYDRI